MRITVCFYGQSDPAVIEELGGMVIDELEYIPEVLIVDVPDDETFEKVVNHSQIQHAEKEKWIETSAVANSIPDYDNNRAYHHTILNLKDYWDRGFTGKGMKIGLVDSAGVNNIYVNITDGIAYDSTLPDYTYAFSNHSTACAGILVGRPVYTGNPTFKISGVAPEATFYHAAVGATNTGSTVNLTYAFSAINWMIGKKVDVISCSWSGTPDNRTPGWDALTIAAYNAGIPIFCAIGNSGSGTIVDESTFPANCPYVYPVAGIDQTYTRYNQSTTSSLIWMAAPAIGVYTTNNNPLTPTTPGEDYQSFSGTSAACPLVAGIYVLYKQALPEKTLPQIITIMQNAARQLKGYTPGVKNLEFGYGIPMPSPEILRKPITAKSGLKLESHTTSIVTPSNNTTINSLANNFTAEVTFSLEATGGGAFPIRKWNPANNSIVWGLSLDTVAKMYNSYVNGGTGITSYGSYQATFNTGNIAKEPQTWHLVYTHPNLYLYRNGVRVDAPFWEASGIDFGTGDINNSYIEFGSFIKGTFYKGRLYNRVLSASEIQSIVNTNLRITNGLVLEYIPKGNEVNTLLDTSGNGFHGTVQGGATPTVKRLI